MPVSLRAEPVPDYPHDKGRYVLFVGRVTLGRMPAFLVIWIEHWKHVI